MDEIRVVAVMEALTVTGPAKNLIQFCRGTRDAKVTVATFFRGDTNQKHAGQFMAALREAGIEADTIRECFRFDVRVIAQLREIVRRRSPDIVQTHGVKSHFLMWRSGLRRQHRWIAFHHGYTDEDFKMRLYNRLNRWSLPAADRVVTVCRPFAEMLARNGVERRRIRVLPNSVAEAPRASAEDVRHLRQELGIKPEERFILSIGRFSREKAQADLIHAAARLTERQPDLAFRLVLVGDGPERRRLAGIAEKLRNKVMFTGQTQNVAPYYGAADLFVLPSHSEGSPNVILEAMAAGAPIVATRVGGVPEMVENEWSALLVPAGDPGAMAEAMGRVLADHGLADRIAGNAATAAAGQFSPNAYRQALLAIYSELRQPTGTVEPSARG